MFNPELLRPEPRRPSIDRRTGAIIGRRPLQRHRAARQTASRRRRSGQIEPAADTRSTSGSSTACPTGSRRRTRSCSSRGSALAYQINHKTVVRLGRRHLPPARPAQRLHAAGRQPAHPVQGGRDERRRRPADGSDQRDLPADHDHAGPGVQAPDRLQTGAPLSSASCRCNMVGRRELRGARWALHLQRERNINQLQPGTTSGQPRCHVERAASVPGLRRHPALRELGPLASTTACRSTWSGASRKGLGFGVAYTLSKLRDNASDKRDILFNAYDDSGYWSASRTTTAPTCFNVHYLYELPFWREQDTADQEDPGRLAGLGRDLLPVRPAVVRLAR